MPFDPLKFMIDAVKTAVGNIASLKTQTKTNCVSAINEVSDQIEALGPYNGLDSSSTTAALSAAQGKVLNQEIGKSSTIITPTAGSNISILYGGYVRFGKIVILCMKFKTLAQISQDSIIFSNIPGSYANNFFFIPSGYNPSAYSCRSGNTSLYSNVVIPANTECNLNGCYLTS